MKIVETDNLDGDYPTERFLNLPHLSEDHAHLIANAINDGFNEYTTYPRYWKVVKDNYKLQEGFKP